MRSRYAVCLLVVMLASLARAQTGDPFAAMHARLAAAADAALAQPSPAVTLGGARPDVVRPESNATYTAALSMTRVEKLRPAIDPILREHGLPAELARVVAVESAGKLDALSPKGARGAWQIMPETARRYGLVVSGARDDRLDLRKSTQAAARYLHDLYAQFGSWPLALAAYNAGEQAVQRAMQRTGSRDFVEFSRALPLETRAYVPAVLSAMSVVKPSTASRSGGRIVYAEIKVKSSMEE